MKLYATTRHRTTLVWISAGVIALHTLFCVHLARTPSEGGWQWFPAFLVDFPASLLTLLATSLSVPPSIAFGVIGSIWWVFVVWVASWIYWGARRPAA